MRVLLTDGSGLTSKQAAYRLGCEGHHVEVLAPSSLCLSRFTRHVRQVHPVPPYGPDPIGWLEAALDIWSAGNFDLLLPTQEQVAVLSLAEPRLDDLGVTTVVPPFPALIQVQDKVAAYRTLTRLELPQPEATVVVSAEQLAHHPRLPVFVKRPIGTATTGVNLVRTSHELADVAVALETDGVFEEGGVLVQTPEAGPLVMVQSVFDHGRLVAYHACERRAEGINGGASHKRSVALTSARGHLEVLGENLGWHGALSADVIVGEVGPLIIDINPRLVEPANAFASGVDLVGAMVAIARGLPAPTARAARSGVETHQVLLALLGAAATGRRTRVATALVDALFHRGTFADSAEELSPVRHDPLAALPVVAAATATLIRPSTCSWFAEGSVANYALTARGWQSVVDAALKKGLGPDRQGPDQPGPDWPR